MSDIHTSPLFHFVISKGCGDVGMRSFNWSLVRGVLNYLDVLINTSLVASMSMTISIIVAKDTYVYHDVFQTLNNIVMKNRFF